jgi:hypothetical protein
MCASRTKREENSMTDYEQLRDSAPSESRIEWRDGDRWSSYLREKDEELKADESLSEQGKYEKAEEYRAKTEPRIQRAYEKARDHLAEEVKRQRGASVPMPGNKTLFANPVKDSTELVAIQTEAASIQAKVERTQNRMPAGMKAGGHATDVLRESFAQGMEVGGVEGTVKCRGALRAAEALGVPVDDVVSAYREQRHYEAADEAFRLENLRLTVPSGRSVPTNPFAAREKPPQGGDFHTGRGATLFKGRPAPQLAPQRRGDGFGRRRKPPWK